MYDVPGKADAASDSLKETWNQTIQTHYERLKLNHPQSKLLANSEDISATAPTNAVRWAANPAVPLDCLDGDEEITRKLCNFGIRGRHILHNEYLEYGVINRFKDGVQHSKRIVLTTELREYWTMLAVHEPQLMRSITEQMLNRTVEWDEFYGPGITDPSTLNTDERLSRFSQFVAGDGGGLVRGVSSQPVGSLNRDNVLFMTHPINGLDDLIFIVMFGAKAYFVRDGNGTEREPSKFEIFGNGNALACRNADPAAALAASAVAREGRTIAFANPLGMYIITDPAVLRLSFLINGDPIPEEWIRLSRGTTGMFQRLEFGPPDEDDHVLEDITVVTGGDERPLAGGYDIAKKVEVGPLLLVGQSQDLDPSEKIFRAPIASPTPCSLSPECPEIKQLRNEFEMGG